MWAPLYSLGLESAFLRCSLQNPVTQRLQPMQASMWTAVDPPPVELDILKSLRWPEGCSWDLPDHTKSRRVHKDSGPATAAGLQPRTCARSLLPEQPVVLSSAKAEGGRDLMVPTCTTCLFRHHRAAGREAPKAFGCQATRKRLSAPNQLPAFD